MGMNEHLEKMSLNEAIEVATKYAEDIAIFASVDKYAVSKVCEVLLEQLQAYKEKEDRLREVCNLAIKNGYSYASAHHSGVLTNAHEILEILNEGDK